MACSNILYDIRTPRYVTSSTMRSVITPFRRGSCKKAPLFPLVTSLAIHLDLCEPESVSKATVLVGLTFKPSSSRQSTTCPRYRRHKRSSRALVKVSPPWRSSANRLRHRFIHSSGTNWDRPRRKWHIKTAHNVGAPVQPCRTPFPLTSHRGASWTMKWYRVSECHSARTATRPGSISNCCNP